MALPEPHTALFTDAQDFHRACAITVMAFGREGDDLFAGAARSHICVRPATDTDHDALFVLGMQLGNMHTQPRPNGLTHWVQLDKPINGFNWLEITPPKTNPATTRPHPTGPQMLVWVDTARTTGPELWPTNADPRVELRCQGQSVATILGLGE